MALRSMLHGNPIPSYTGLEVSSLPVTPNEVTFRFAPIKLEDGTPSSKQLRVATSVALPHSEGLHANLPLQPSTEYHLDSHDNLVPAYFEETSAPRMRVKAAELSSVLQQIAAQKQLFDEACEKQVSTGEKLDEATKKEIDKIKKPTNVRIKPSEDLKITILEHCTAIVRRINIQKNYQKMIESNITILNGKTISEIEQQFYDEQREEYPMEDDADVKRLFERRLKNRTKQINSKS